MITMSIFGSDMTNADGGRVRQFYNGVTRREEVWMDRDVRGKEHAHWAVYCVWDIRDGGNATEHKTLEAATNDYDRRIKELTT